MSTSDEIRKEQNDRLFDLLKLKQLNQDIEVKGLNDLIKKLKASMTQEDVAWVEKVLSEG